MINPRLVSLLSEAKKYIYYQVLSQWFILILRILMVFTASYIVDSFIDNSLSKAKMTSGFIFTIYSLYICYIL